MCNWNLFIVFTARYCGYDITLGEGESRAITSFNYPSYNPYQRIYRCTLQVTVPNGRQIRVQFVDVNLTPRRESLTLNDKHGDGKQIYTGFDTPQEDYITDGNTLDIGFYTSGEPVRGFSLVVSDYLAPGKTILLKKKKSTLILATFKGGRMGRSDTVSLWYVSLLINTRFRFFILE